jgi:hypothetical protein
MNRTFSKKNLIGLGVVALVTFGVGGSAFAVSQNSWWWASRHNTVGGAFVNMSPASTTFCYLAGVETTETDTGSETARCRITRGQFVWTLEAILGTSSDADIECEAYCFNN